MSFVLTWKTTLLVKKERHLNTFPSTLSSHAQLLTLGIAHLLQIYLCSEGEV